MIPEVRLFFESLQQEGLLHRIRLDGCQVGVVSHDTGEPMKKPWTIKTTSRELSQVLNLTCPRGSCSC